ncbi:MAG: 50S ribosomal protein L22 [Candidatus Wildermuthbacteria bacterium]|nr:50S ribosomal protein L22 [Candidatus Wildermuthbacteria bacterium]
MKAHLRYLRIAPRKVRLVADLIRGKNIADARRVLSFVEKRAATPVLKTLNSAAAAATNNFQAEEGNLFVSQVFVNEGPKLKRIRPRAKGTAYPIQRKTSHITVVLGELVAGKKAEKSVQKVLKTKELQEKKAGGNSRKRTFFEKKEKAKVEGQRGGKRNVFQRKSI